MLDARLTLKSIDCIDLWVQKPIRVHMAFRFQDENRKNARWVVINRKIWPIIDCYWHFLSFLKREPSLILLRHPHRLREKSEVFAKRRRRDSRAPKARARIGFDALSENLRFFSKAVGVAAEIV